MVLVFQPTLTLSCVRYAQLATARTKLSFVTDVIKAFIYFVYLLLWMTCPRVSGFVHIVFSGIVIIFSSNLAAR